MVASTTYIVFLFLSILVVIGSTEDFKPISYKQCGTSYSSFFNSVRNHCLYVGPKVPTSILQLNFTDRDVNALKTIVRAEIGASYFFHSLDNDDPCKGSNLTCPLQAGKTYYYTDSVEIKESYPATNVRVRWIFTDPNNDDNLCIMFLAKVQE
uniref:ML domain-containing protein n=1 Tax=Syphacia muris TaxID=451379 RepID=A0A0N5ABS8_9BILA